MKIIFLIFILTMFVFDDFSQTIRTVGTGGNYATLASAFTDVNNGTLTGSIEFQVISNTTETTTAALNASGTGSSNYSSIVIYPTVANVAISGNLAAPLILFDGADNVTFDGRTNRSGTTVNLTIDNQSTSSTVRTSAIFFNNSAENNLVSYCTLKGGARNASVSITLSSASGSGTTITCTSTTGLEVGSTLAKTGGTGTLNATTYVTSIISATQFTINTAPSLGLSGATLSATSPSSGIVVFGFSTSGNGNDNNTINYCNITRTNIGQAWNPINGVFSQGTVGFSNDNNAIRNSNIYNLWYAGSTSQFIHLNSYTSAFIINANSFYNSTAIALSDATAHTYSFIYADIDLGNGNVEITDNYFGGTSAQCVGSNLSFTYSGTGLSLQLIPINLAGIGSNASVNSSVSLIQGNTIKKITFNNTTWANNAPPYFIAIDVAQGKCNIKNNVIGSTTENSLILGTNPSSGTTAYLSYGIRSASCPFGGGDTHISGNTIGGIRTQDGSNRGRGFYSIFLSGTCAIDQNIYIENNLIGSETMANSIELAPTGGNSFQAIYLQIAKANYYVDSNKIMNITNNATSATNWSLQGIYHAGSTVVINTNCTITNNTIKYLKTSSAGLTSTITGINIDRTAAPTASITNTISNNVIQHLTSLNSTNVASKVRAINLTLNTENTLSQTTTIQNNFISDLYLNATSATAEISGISYTVGPSGTAYDRSASITSNFSNNIISLGNGVTANCLINGIWEQGISGATNNIYHNTINIGGTSPAGSTSKTYCMFKTSSAQNGTRNIRNNIFNNSRAISGGASNTIHYSLHLTSNATTIDYNNHFVSSTGSGNFRAVLGSTDYTDIASWRTALTTSRENNSLNIDPVFTNTTGANPWDYAKSATTNGVTISGYSRDYWNVSRANPPQMGAYDNAHQIWIGGTSTDWNTASNWSPASIPSSGMSITVPDQSNDPFLDQTRTISQLRLYSGSKLNLNGKSLTIQDSVLLLGQFIGSSTSSLTFNNSGNVGMIYFDQSTLGTTNSLLNLTVNKSSGSLKLGTNLKVNGSLILSNGVLDLNGKTLQMAGSDLQTANGSINASLTNSKVSFQNQNPITIPSNSFTGNVYNVELNSSSTVNSEQTFTISNNLDLINGNLIVSDDVSITVEDSILRTAGASLSLGATGSGKIEFKGSYMKLNEVGNLTIHPTSSGDILLQEDLTIHGSLDLLNGKLALGNRNLLLEGELGTIQNGSYIKTESTGKLIRKTNATNTTYLFPIGQSSYTPISVNFQGGIQSNSTLSARIVSGSHPQMNAEQMEYVRTNYYWEMNSENMTNPNYSVTLNYQDALVTNGLTETELDLRPAKWSAETGWKSSDQCSICHSSGIIGSSSLNTELNTITWSGVVGFSDFMGLGQGNGSPLPVELLYLKTNCLESNTVDVEWATASEQNSSHFLVQQSRDGSKWQNEKIVMAAGNSTEKITYNIKIPSIEESYIRLIQFDINGDSTIYGPVLNTCKAKDFYINIFPNPNKGNFQVVMNHPTSFPTEIKLMDITGKTIKSIGCDGAIENSILLYTFNEKLTAGNYLVKIQLENGLIINKKIAVQ
jgi:hypothetical protein